MYVTGPAGIGKTALTGAVKRRVQADRLGDVVVIDAIEFNGEPASLDRLVRSRAAPWPRQLGDVPVVIFIDGYERVKVEQRRQLREIFISSIRGPVVLAVCERRLPRDFLLQWVGWRAMIEEIPLQVLSRAETLGALCAQGLGGDDAAELADITGGHPLLISVAGMVASGAGHRDLRIAQEATRLPARRRRRRVRLYMTLYSYEPASARAMITSCSATW